jgi:hypothetical protein
MKSFIHPRHSLLAIRSTDSSFKLFYSLRTDFTAGPILFPAKDRFNSSLWLSKFAIHRAELLLKA